VSYNDGSQEVTKKFIGVTCEDLYWTNNVYWVDIVSSTGVIDTSAIHKITPDEINQIVEKEGFVDGDVFLGENSESTPTAFEKIKILGSSIKSTLKTYFDGIYQSNLGFTPESTSNKSTNVNVDRESNTKYPSVKAIVDYADSLVVGLWDDRGSYDASVNVFPSTGGSGPAGTILKGDIWTISVGGVLGGTTVIPGQTVRALFDSPEQVGGDWAISVGSSEVSLGGLIHALTTKDVLHDNDEFGLSDSESSNTGKKTTWSNIKSKLATYLQGISLAFTNTVSFVSSYLRVLGSSTGYTAIASANASANNYTATLPAKDITVAGLDDIITDHSKLSNLSWINSGHISGQTSERIPSFGTDGNPNLLETIETTFYVGDFTGDFSGLATESNWTDNITALVAGALGDRAIGIGSLGCIYECFYTQYGWARDYINPFITDSALIASLQTSGNWTKVTDTISYYNASTGDRGQRYYANGYNYECINGTAHTWIRIGALDTVEVTDINYIPKPQIEVGKGIGDIITIPAKYDIVSIVAESETTTAGNITIGRTATAEVSSLYITSGCTANGNCQIVLDGITFTVALTTSQNTATSVATAIRATSFVSGSQVWTTGGSGTTVTFTSNKYKAATDATYSDNGTGATGTMTTSTQGVDPNNDIITSTALSTVIGNKKNLTVIKSVDYPTSSAQSIYVNISSVATVKLHFILQKLFE
jgi:hypothetical protein